MNDGPLTRDDLRAILREELDARMAPLRAQMDGLPLIHRAVTVIQQELRVHTRMLNALTQDVRMSNAAVNDTARESVTPGEVEAIHHDLNRVVRELAELAVRLEAIEA